MDEGDVAVLGDPGFQLLPYDPGVAARRHREPGDLTGQSTDGGTDRQRMRGQPDGVPELAPERLWRPGFEFVDDPPADRGRELFQRVPEDAGTQCRALGQVQEHVPVEVTHLQPGFLVSLLCPGDHLHHLHRVVDREPGDRCGQRAERARHHLADVASCVHMVGAGHRRVHLVQVTGQRGDRPSLQPPDSTGFVDGPFEVHRPAPLLLGPAGAGLDRRDLDWRQNRRRDSFVDHRGSVGIEHDVIGSNRPVNERLAESGNDVDHRQVPPT